MALYCITTTAGQFVRTGINIRRMATAAAHEFPEGVIEVKKLDGAAGLASLERAGVALSQAARSALAQRRSKQRSESAWRRRSKVRKEAEQVREEARQAAAEEKQRVKLETAAAKRRAAARLKRAEKKADVKMAEMAPRAIHEAIALPELDEWDGDLAPWD